MTNIEIWDPYAVTDYYAEGGNFVLVVRLNKDDLGEWYADTIILPECGWFVLEGVLR